MKKKIITIFIILLTVFLIIIGFYSYNRYLKQRNSQKKKVTNIVNNNLNEQCDGLICIKNIVLRYNENNNKKSNITGILVNKSDTTYEKLCIRLDLECEKGPEIKVMCYDNINSNSQLHIKSDFAQKNLATATKYTLKVMNNNDMEEYNKLLESATK